MEKINLYATHRLDPAAPPGTLLQQLDAEAANTRDRLQRSRIATARAIVADPAKRATYDRYLTDPQAEITEATLAAISGRPVPSAGPLGNRSTKLALGILAGFLVLALIVAVVIVATAGDDEPVNAASSSAGASQQVEEPAQTYDADDLDRAYWGDNRSSTPRLAVRLDAAYDLPAGFGPLVANTDVDLNCVNSVDCQLVQYRDRTLGLYLWDNSAPDGQKARLAIIGQDGRVVADKRYANNNDVPGGFDRSEQALGGYFHITADGVEIPAAAVGTEDGMVSASVIRPDAFQDNTFWVLLHGGTQLYRGSLVAAS